MIQGLWMSKEREVLYVTATRIRFMCPMNFNKFPMDTQTCKFQVESKIIIWTNNTNFISRLAHSTMTTPRWCTEPTTCRWCPTPPRASSTTRLRLRVWRLRTLSIYQPRLATTVWRASRWSSTGQQYEYKQLQIIF